MPRITGLEPCGKPQGACRLYVDDAFHFEVPGVLLARARLSVGQTLSAADLDALRRQAAEHRAMESALHYLSFRIRSRAEIERHLRRNGHEPDASAWAVDRCRQLGYVDDLAFATSFARDRIRLRPQGMRRLRADLRARGVSEADAREGIDAAFREEQVNEAELLDAVATRRWRALQSAEPVVARRRLAAFLSRRGFPSDRVRETVARLTGAV